MKLKKQSSENYFDSIDFSQLNPLKKKVSLKFFLQNWLRKKFYAFFPFQFKNSISFIEKVEKQNPFTIVK